MGQRTYSPGSPAGWPDRSADWDGASALIKRIEWADAVGQRVGSRRDANGARSPVAGRQPDASNPHRDCTRRQWRAGNHPVALRAGVHAAMNADQRATRDDGRIVVRYADAAMRLAH